MSGVYLITIRLKDNSRIFSKTQKRVLRQAKTGHSLKIPRRK